MKHSVATIIHYCTNDYRFLRKNVEEAKLFSDLILIPVCDHYFNGTPEDRELLERCYQEFPECQFIEFAYDAKQLYHPYISGQIDESDWGKFWHGTARYIGALFIPPEIEYVLFLDADEIINGKRFKNWLLKKEYRKWEAMRLQAHTYVQRASLKIRSSYPCALFAKHSSMDPLIFLNVHERYGVMQAFSGRKKEGIVDENGEPFLHHYTWVRTKDECVRKASSWGHRLDKDWTLPIERMFQDPTQELMDLNVEFEEAEVFFDPLEVLFPSLSAKLTYFENVQKVTRATIRKKEIEKLL